MPRRCAPTKLISCQAAKIEGHLFSGVDDGATSPSPQAQLKITEHERDRFRKDLGAFRGILDDKSHRLDEVNKALQEAKTMSMSLQDEVGLPASPLHPPSHFSCHSTYLSSPLRLSITR